MEAPYTLVKIDATPVVPLAVTWHNLSVSDSTPVKKTKAVKTATAETPVATMLLDNISGDAIPGELLAIVAPSNAGPSALLAAIAGRTPTSEMTGTVRINQQAVCVTPTIAGFVGRETPLHAMLTVQDHVNLQSQLRIGEATQEERSARVSEVLTVTGLTDVAQSLIGSGDAQCLSGLSGLHRKLVELATELLPGPSILLLEEPTAGLDAFAANTLIRRLQSLARHGHTVVVTMTLDQLTSAMFSVFDKLHLVADDSATSRTLFHGRPVDCLAFFQTNNLACPPLTNPFEFLMHQLHNANESTEVVTRVHHLVAAWTAHTQQQDHGGLVPSLEISSGTPSNPIARTNAVATQLRVLFRSSLLRLSHDVGTIRGRLLQYVGIAIVLGLVFLQLDMTQTHVQTFGSACFFLTAAQFITNAVASFQTTPHDVAIALDDHQHSLYHAVTWYVVKNLCDLPTQILYPMVFLVPAYFLIGFPVDATVFFTMYLFLALVASTGVAVGLFASCVAPKRQLVAVIAVLVIAPSMVFGGAFMNRKTTPVYFLWLQQLSPVKYCYHGLMRAFWTHVGVIPCPPGGICRATSGLAALASNYIKADKFASDWHILLAINLALRVLGGLALWRRAAALRKM